MDPECCNLTMMYQLLTFLFVFYHIYTTKHSRGKTFICDFQNFYSITIELNSLLD